MKFKTQPAQVLKILIAVIIVLIFLSSLSNYLKVNWDNGYTDFLHRMFNVDFESNIPTFYSSIVLLISSLMLLLIARQLRTSGQSALLWMFLGFIFLFLAIDETAQIHEKLIRSLRARWNLKGYLYSGWIIPYGVGLLALGLLYIKFLFELPKKTRILMVSSGLIYVFGAIVMEMISVNIGFAHERNDKSVAYFITMTLEEFFEMFGSALFLFTLLEFCIKKFGTINLKIQ